MQQPKYAVFFDVDGTLISIKSMISFLQFYYRKHSTFKWIGEIKYRLYDAKLRKLEKKDIPREILNQQYYKLFQGIPLARLQSTALAWFEYIQLQNIYLSHVVTELRKHQRKGGVIVFVSGSFKECLSPLAECLNVKHILATQLETKQGVCTGNIFSPQTIGKGKAIAMQYFLNQYEIDAEHCYAYGDHISDLPMLESVGHPRVIEGDHALENIAKQKNWIIL